MFNFFKKIFDFFKGVFLFFRGLFLGKKTAQVSDDKGTDQIPVTEKTIQVSDDKGTDQIPVTEKTIQVSDDKGADQIPVTEKTIQVSDEGRILLDSEKILESSSRVLKNDSIESLPFNLAYIEKEKKSESGYAIYEQIPFWKYGEWLSENTLYYAIINQMHYANDQGGKNKNAILNLKTLIQWSLSKEIREGAASPHEGLISNDIVISNVVSNKKIKLNKADLIKALDDVYLFCNSDKVSGQRKMEKSEKKSLESEINSLFREENNIDIVDFIISSKNIDLLKAFAIEKSYKELALAINLDNLRKLIKRCCELKEYKLGGEVSGDLKEGFRSGDLMYFVSKGKEDYSCNSHGALGSIFYEFEKMLKEGNSKTHQEDITKGKSDITNAFDMCSTSSSDKQAAPSITEKPGSDKAEPSVS